METGSMKRCVRRRCVIIYNKTKGTFVTNSILQMVPKFPLFSCGNFKKLVICKNESNVNCSFSNIETKPTRAK